MVEDAQALPRLQDLKPEVSVLEIERPGLYGLAPAGFDSCLSLSLDGARLLACLGGDAFA